MSSNHCQCVDVGGCLWVYHLRVDVMVAVITKHCTIPPPGDSGGRTTSGRTGEGEHRSGSNFQLESDFTWQTDLAYIGTSVIGMSVNTAKQITDRYENTGIWGHASSEIALQSLWAQFWIKKFPLLDSNFINQYSITVYHQPYNICIGYSWQNMVQINLWSKHSTPYYCKKSDIMSDKSRMANFTTLLHDQFCIKAKTQVNLSMKSKPPALSLAHTVWS